MGTIVSAELIKLCSISGVTLLRDCDTNEPILFVHVTSSDGDVIQTDSTEFVAPATDAGVFSTMGYYRSYYADALGGYLNPQPVNICPSSNVNTIEVVCRCDDVDLDGVGEISYKQIVSIDPNGVATVLATYNRLLTAPYTPVNPIDCSVPGDNLIATRPKYRVISGSDTWVLNADSVMPTISVSFTVVAVGNVLTPPTLQTAEGIYPLYQSQSVSFSAIYGRDVTGLRVPLVLTTNSGDAVCVAWAEEVV